MLIPNRILLGDIGHERLIKSSKIIFLARIAMVTVFFVSYQSLQAKTTLGQYVKVFFTKKYFFQYSHLKKLINIKNLKKSAYIVFVKCEKWLIIFKVFEVRVLYIGHRSIFEITR